MDHQFKVGDRVRLTKDLGMRRLSPGDEGTVVPDTEEITTGTLMSVKFDRTACSWRDGGHYQLRRDAFAPAEPPTPTIPASQFEIYGCGFQSLLSFVTAFQEAGEENFSVSWTLKGQAAVPSIEGGA